MGCLPKDDPDTELLSDQCQPGHVHYTKRYASIDDFMRREYETHGKGGQFSSEGREEWDLGVVQTEAAKRAVSGDSDMLSNVNAISKNITADVGPGPAIGFLPSVAGDYVDVGDYLGGNPECMRAPCLTERYTRHVNIYISTFVSCYYNAGDLFTRGAALLALLEQLQVARINADVYLIGNAQDTYSSTENFLSVIQIESRPLNLSQSGFCIAHPAFARNILYPSLKHYVQIESILPASPSNSLPVYEKHMRTILGMSDSDIFVGPCVYSSSDSDIASNPSAWVQRNVNQVTSRGQQ